MRWKEYLEYEKNRDVNVNKIYNKLGMDINTVTQNSEAQLYTPNKDSSKDVSMWLTRNNKDEEAERVKKLQEISDRNKANIDNIVAESKIKKTSTNNTSLSPLENDSATKNKKKKKSFLSDFVGGVLDVGNNLLLAEHNLNKSTKEAMLNSDIDMMKSMGLTDEEIAAKMKKMTGVDNVGSGADVVNAKNERLAKNKADIYDKYSTVSDDDSAISKIGKNIAYSAPQMLTYAIPGAGQVLGTVNSYGDGYGNAKNKGLDDSQANLYGLREGAFDLAVVPSLLKGKSTLGKSIANAAAKGTAEGVVRQGSEYLFKDEEGNSIGAKTPGEFAKNVAMQGAMSTLMGAGAHGANKAIGKASDVIGKNVDTRFNNMFDEMDGFVKTVDTDNVGLNMPFSKVKTEKSSNKNYPKKVEVVNEIPKVKGLNVDVNRDLSNIKEVGDRNVRLLSNEMGELKPYIREEATATLRELDDVIKGERFAHYDDVTGETVVTGTQKQVSSTIQAIQDLIPNASYDKIRKGLNDIVEGKDTSIAKKIELILDDNLSNGRLSGNEGFEVPANSEYLWIKKAYDGLNNGDTSTLFGGNDNVMVSESRAAEPRLDNTVKIANEVASDKIEMDSPIGNSRFANVTHQNKHDVPIEYKQAVEKLETSYNIGNNKTDNAAAKEVVEGDSNSLAKWFNGGFESLDKGMDTHIGMELAKKALADGDVNTYSEIVSKLSEKASKNGQDIQALAFYNSQTPEGMAVSVTKNIRKIQDDVLSGKSAKVREQFDIAKSEMNEEQLIEFCKKNKIPYLDSEQLSNVQDIQRQILAASDEKEIVRLTALRNKEISKNIPKSTLSKVNDYRYKSMLFNPKTLLSRNPIASLTRMGTDAIGNPLGVALDKLASNKTGLRTRFGNDFSQTGNVIKNSIDDMNFDFKNGVNTSDGNMYGIDFNGGSDKLSDKAFKWAMELGDRPFADTVENAQLNGYMKEMGITDIKNVPSEMRELFKLRGKENNFQNKHYATDWVNKGKRIPVIGQLLDATMPFVNTNLNLLQDTVERSPVGLAKGIYDYSKVLRGKTGTDVLGAQKKAVDEITKGAVGLGTTALGYALADNLTGNYSNDSKVKAVQQDMGMRENALKIGDYNFDLSQLSTLMPNMVLGKHLKDNGLSSTSVGNGIGQQIETAIKSSPFSGLTNFTDDMSEHGLQTAVTNLVGNYANQYVPTIIKQTNNLLDPLRRDTYDENPLKRQINNIVSGVPGLSLTLASQHNTLGEDKLKYPNMEDGEVVFNSYLNPFLTSKAGGDNYEQLQRILNVANEAGDSDHIPSRYSKRFNYTTTGGDRISYNLSNDELAEWKRLYAKYSKNAKSQKQFEEALEKANDDMRAKVKPRNAKK